MKSNTRNSAYTKSYNRKLIINIIRREPLSRAELSRKTGLTRASISIIADELISDGIIFENGIAVSDLGRKPVLLDINPISYYALGLDISRDKCSVGIVNIKGTVVERKEINLSHAASANAALKIITDEIRKLLCEVNIPHHKLLGLGVSTPGPVDVLSGIIINPPNFDLWKNINIVQELKNELHFNILLENNSVALALAEKYFGIGKRFSSFILLAVDIGIGSGIVINNKLYRGVGGFGGEIGHTSINFNGELCNCGNVGCLELYASIPAILRNPQKLDSSIKTWDNIVDKAISGEQYFLGIIEEEAKYLSIGIVNAVNTLELEAVVITGYIKYKPELILEKIRENVNKSAINRNIHPVKIYTSEIVYGSEVIAASTVVFDSFFNS